LVTVFIYASSAALRDGLVAERTSHDGVSGDAPRHFNPHGEEIDAVSRRRLRHAAPHHA